MRWAPDAVALAVAASVGFAACSTGEDATSTRTEPACGTDPPLSFENFGGPFFLNWCTGCHSSALAEGVRGDAPLEVNFDTLEGIRAHSGLIRLRAVHATEMPPAGGPHDADRELLGRWLACGAPAATDGFAPPVPLDAGARKPPTGACAERREPLGAAALPRCSAETWACTLRCPLDHPDDEDATDACREACQEADTTPPDADGVTCSGCTLNELLACGWERGCADQIAEFMCCIEGCRTESCFEEDCGQALAAFGYCIGYSAEGCFDADDGALAKCFDKTPRPTRDAGPE